jgi:hypothetical protein
MRVMVSMSEGDNPARWPMGMPRGMVCMANRRGSAKPDPE